MEIRTRLNRPIGGYMELQLPVGQTYYPNLIALNTARNALEYILTVRKYTTIYIPYYTCEVILEPIRKLNVQYKFYSLNENLDPIIDFILDKSCCMLYTNYFGIKTETVEKLTNSIKNLIVDNAQAFFTEPIGNQDTFYSCRKFFGVADGAYLNISTHLDRDLEEDKSFDRFSHLIKSIDLDIEKSYGDYLRNKAVLNNNEIKKMSKLTQVILDGIDYEENAKARKRNFKFLHEHLFSANILDINFSSVDVPMVYPLLLEDNAIKEKLIAQKIFVATYWPNVYDWAPADSYEYFLTKNLVSLPIDHRYNLDDMDIIVKALKLMI